MKTNHVSLFQFCLVSFLALGLSSLPGQETGITAQKAMGILESRFGTSRVGWIVELRGYEGQDQPQEWEIFAYDPDTPYLVRKFWVGEATATNEGPADDFFPRRTPSGYLTRAEIRLDSNAAFTIAEVQARKAKMGFDRLNYFLRCREYSREPVWLLELVDFDKRIVGKVYLSAETGEVLRTVWIYRGERGREDGSSLLIDSSAPAGGVTDLSSRGSEAPADGETMPPAGAATAPPTLPDDSDAAPVPGRAGPPMPDVPALNEDPLSPGSSLPKPPPPPTPDLEPPVENDGPMVPEKPIKPKSSDDFDTRIPPPPLPPAQN